MSERQNIDRLFQEKFKDFEANPSDKVWNDIQRKMNNAPEDKATPTALPLWLKICGIAAVFLIGFSVGNNFFFKTAKSDNSSSGITSGSEKDKKDTAPNKNTTILSKDNFHVNANPVTTTETENITKTQNKLQSNSEAESLNTHFNNTPRTEHQFSPKNESKHNNSTQNNTILTTTLTAETNKNAVTAAQIKVVNKDFSNNNTTLVNAQTDEVQSSRQQADNLKSPTTDEAELTTENGSDLLFENPSSKVAFEVGKERYSDKNERGIVVNELNREKNQSISSRIELSKEDKNLKKSLPKTNGLAAIDSIQMAKGKETINPLDQLLKEKEEQEKEEKHNTNSKNKWLASSKISPIFMNAKGNNSAIDQQFNNNEKNFKTTFSYGANISYALTNKLSVRTGIHTLTMEYNTNDILYYQSENSKNIQNIRRNTTGNTIQIEDKDSRSMAFSATNIVTQKSSGAISQRMGYIEVPMEASYKLVDKKFGMEVIGGLSTLFLTQNDISLVSSRQDMKIGEASNLNDIHISSNIGLGFKYSFAKSFEANMEPMFKYQINTYRNNAGDFKPYFFGLYTGISYRF